MHQRRGFVVRNENNNIFFFFIWKTIICHLTNLHKFKSKANHAPYCNLCSIKITPPSNCFSMKTQSLLVHFLPPFYFGNPSRSPGLIWLARNKFPLFRTQTISISLTTSLHPSEDNSPRRVHKSTLFGPARHFPGCWSILTMCAKWILQHAHRRNRLLQKEKGENLKVEKFFLYKPPTGLKYEKQQTSCCFSLKDLKEGIKGGKSLLPPCLGLGVWVQLLASFAEILRREKIEGKNPDFGCGEGVWQCTVLYFFLFFLFVAGRCHAWV